MVRVSYKVVSLSLLCILLFISCIQRERKSEYVYTIPLGSECIEIISSDSLGQTSYYFRELPGGHPAIVFDDKFLALDDSISELITIPYSSEIKDIHWKKGECFFLADSVIYYGSINGDKHPIFVGSSNISCFRMIDNGFGLIMDSTLFRFSFSENDINYHLRDTISCMESTGDLLLFSKGKELYVLKDSQIACLLSVNSDISAFSITADDNIFVSTQDSLLFITPNHKSILITNRKAKELNIIGDHLFIIWDMGKYDKSTTTMANITTANTCTMSGGSR